VSARDAFNEGDDELGRSIISGGAQRFGLQIDANEITLDQLDSFIAQGAAVSGPEDLTAEQKEFKDLTAGMSQEDITRARRIKLGLEPRAVGSAIQTITETGTAPQIAATEAEIQGAKEEAKLIEQLKLKPEIQQAVTSSVASAKADADAANKQRSDSAAFNLYSTAMQGLSTALGGTETGPVFGLLPAITSEAQIADGAIAAVAPILKQVFRVAGEGTFTDSDQRILNEMIPTRKDTPQARASKLNNINSIVRAKLGQIEQPAQTDQGQPTQQFREGQTATNPQTGERLVFRNGNWEPL